MDDARPPWWVVGLGNPGDRYRTTRHNIGFRLVDRLFGRFGGGNGHDRGDYWVAGIEFDDRRWGLLKPLTYMNRSGSVLHRVPEMAEAVPERTIVVLDDVWLPFGHLRFRSRGSAGGHNGLDSVLGALGTESVPRLRMGVGGAESVDDLAEYVLDPFPPGEEEQIEAWLDRAVDGLRVFVGDPQTAMSQFNGSMPGPGDDRGETAGQEGDDLDAD